MSFLQQLSTTATANQPSSEIFDWSQYLPRLRRHFKEMSEKGKRIAKFRIECGRCGPSDYMTRDTYIHLFGDSPYWPDEQGIIRENLGNIYTKDESLVCNDFVEALRNDMGEPHSKGANWVEYRW